MSTKSKTKNLQQCDAEDYTLESSVHILGRLCDYFICLIFDFVFLKQKPRSPYFVSGFVIAEEKEIQRSSDKTSEGEAETHTQG